MTSPAGKGKVNEKHEDKHIKANRSFPLDKSILVVILLIFQVLIITTACIHTPMPQDVIRDYQVIVEPQYDGSLDITYQLVWEPLDEDENLTWVQIGMANPHYSVYRDSFSDNIVSYRQESYEDGSVYLELNLDRIYTAGEVLELSFRINQERMLCENENGLFYQFVPCWFNAAQVEHYTFAWKLSDGIRSTSADSQNDRYALWEGSLDYGQFRMMKVSYAPDQFPYGLTVHHKNFDVSNCTNELVEKKVAIIICAVIVAGFLAVIQVWAVDSVVSYHRGRGFLTGYGFHVHTDGRSNPKYIRARNIYRAAHQGSGGRRGGGCACACACACAGGGRAGCSQKDTYAVTKEQPEGS